MQGQAPSMTSNSYRHLNLAFNPFGELDRDERVALASVEINHLVEWVEQQGNALQLLADHGRGKSTHLLALHQRLTDIPYIQLLPDQVAIWQDSSRYCIDSIENLSLWQRWKIYRRFDSIAVTSHRDLSREMRLAGFNVKTLIISTTCTDKLLEIFNRRLSYARLDNQSFPTIKRQQVMDLQQQFGDDIRAMEYALYEHFYHLKEASWPNVS